MPKLRGKDIIVDFDSEIMYGSDQCYMSRPYRFPTVGFQLKATEVLIRIADSIREDAGFTPVHPVNAITGKLRVTHGFYDFYVGINGFTDNHMDNCIEFIVIDEDSEDDEEKYIIDLTTEEQNIVYNSLNKQCRKHLGKGCEDLLVKAKKQMEG